MSWEFEKSPSFPNGTSLNKKYLIWSMPYLSTNWKGSITLPKDLEILLPSLVHQPWAKTFFGKGKSAAIRNAGQ